VFFAVFMDALQKGAWNNMIRNVVNFYYGFAQVHREGFWEEQTIDKAFPLADSLARLDEGLEGVHDVLPRLESFALASGGNATMGVLVVGVDPSLEDRMTALRQRVVAGRYLSADAPEAVLAEGVAERLNLGVGDTLVLISQGYHGVNAAGKYAVRGLAHFASPELNKQMVYLPLAEAQWFYGAEGMVTSLALHLDDQGDIPPAMRRLRASLDLDTYEVMDWKELLPDLLQAKQLDGAGNVIIYLILYLIIAFGIFGTILMMTKERAYEFGILISIGMRRGKLALLIWIETVFLGLLGALAGILVSLPVVAYFHRNPIRFSGEYAGLLEQYGFEPIFPAELSASIFITQGLVIFLICSVLALYPLWQIYRLEIVRAMRP
jgi:ABC-type lipoprotein release transport system permease subunit